MIPVRLVVVLVGMTFLVNYPSHYVRAEAETIDLKALAKKARPAVVLLVISDASGNEIATGTGFLVSGDGKLITNHHVIENAASAVAKAENGGLFFVEGMLADDPTNDLVLLKIKSKDLPFLTLGDSEKIEVGERIAVIGSPLGLEGTLSEGIVSAVRDLMGEMRILQISAAISPGSSGSPVLDGKGVVIGVAAALLHDGQALNLAVPVEYVRRLCAKVQPSTKPQALQQPAKTGDDAIYSDPNHRAFWAAYASENWVDLLKCAQRLVAAYSDNAYAYFMLAVAYDRLHFTDDEVVAYRQAIKIRPDYSEAWNNLGVAYDGSRQFEDAVAAFKQAIKLKPDSSESWSGLGTAYGLLGRHEEAEAAFQKAVELNANLASAWAGLGATYLNLEQTEHALAALKRAVELDPKNAYAWYNLSVVYRNSGQLEQSAKAFRLARDLNPSAPFK